MSRCGISTSNLTIFCKLTDEIALQGLCVWYSGNLKRFLSCDTSVSQVVIFARHFEFVCKVSCSDCSELIEKQEITQNSNCSCCSIPLIIQHTHSATIPRLLFFRQNAYELFAGQFGSGRHHSSFVHCSTVCSCPHFQASWWHYRYGAL